MIAPARIGGGPSAAGVSAVDHIVVNQGGAVQQLNDGRQSYGTIASLAGRISVAQEQQRRAKPFSAAAEQIAGDLRNGFECSAALPRKFLLDLRQVVPNQIKNLLCGKQRDGCPPRPTRFLTRPPGTLQHR